MAVTLYMAYCFQFFCQQKMKHLDTRGIFGIINVTFKEIIFLEENQFFLCVAVVYKDQEYTDHVCLCCAECCHDDSVLADKGFFRE
jgi:hypothetical protein